MRLNAAFKIQSVDCEIIGETYRALMLPSICIAVYEGGGLCTVYPYSEDNQCQTASHCLEELDAYTQVEYAD